MADARDDSMAVRPASGYCATTLAAETGCGVAGRTKGTFDGQFGSIDRSGFWDCVYACTTCGACNFISYSRIANDCSWYASCRLDRLSHRLSRDHISIAVRDTANGSVLPNLLAQLGAARTKYEQAQSASTAFVRPRNVLFHEHSAELLSMHGVMPRFQLLPRGRAVPCRCACSFHRCAAVMERLRFAIPFTLASTVVWK